MRDLPLREPPRRALGAIGLALALVVHGGCGAEPSPNCSGLDQPCGLTCCSPNICVAGTCKPPGTCNQASQACIRDTDCCSGTCVKRVCTATCTKSMAGQTCSDSTACCPGLTCSRIGRTCVTAKLLGLGEPCTANAQCASPNLCYDLISANDGVVGGSSCCSHVCASDGACGGNNACMEDNQGHWRCFPLCNSNADCTVYGSTITCKPGTSKGGVPARVCTR